MNKKSRKVYVCTDCGGESTKWQGQCLDCKAWNTYKELHLSLTSSTANNKRSGFTGTLSSIKTLNEVDISEEPRFSTGNPEFDRVLGGGFIKGSSILIGGHPGAGKSTILLQILCYLSQQMEALYVSGEESIQQIATRAKRLELPRDKLKILAETNAEHIIAIAEQNKPKIIVIDSIQVIHLNSIESSPGGVSQVRESAACLTRFAKKTNTVLVIVGHVTKDNSLAGPMTLSHIIDTQLMLESSEDSRFRIIRATKNRFGQVNELGIFAMTDKGIKPIKNPSAIFLSRSQELTPGSIINILWEGTRPLLVEIQALVVDSQLGNPRRVVVGIEQNRLSMLLAILARHGGIFTHDQDVFINVVGGIKVNETSADLANLLAIVSSLRNKPLPQNMFAFGEVGLSGEIRPVPNGQERLTEAVKHGFQFAIIPKGNQSKKTIKGLKLITVNKLSDALEAIE